MNCFRIVTSLYQIRSTAAGLMLAGAVAALAFAIEPALRAATAGVLNLPVMVVALLIGVVLNPVAKRPAFAAGLEFAVKKLLRWAIALLGVRIALGDILGLGIGTALLVLGSMAATLGFAMWFARRLGLHDSVGALAGAATAICGASATLAAASVIPSYKTKEADVAFTVIAANLVSTLAMLAYPPLAIFLAFNSNDTGILLGATIHDMAQVVGAGYALSDEVGNTAVVVKLFRVLLLLPIILVIGWWFAHRGEKTGVAKVPVPIFAVMFIVFVVVNSMVPSFESLVDPYSILKPWLVHLSNVGLLIAISAIGITTSIATIVTVGPRHFLVFALTTLLLLAFVSTFLLYGR